MSNGRSVRKGDSEKLSGFAVVMVEETCGGYFAYLREKLGFTLPFDSRDVAR
jgi:hypothetical protein